MKEKYILLLENSEKDLTNELSRIHLELGGLKYITSDSIENLIPMIPEKLHFKFFFDFKTLFKYYKYSKNYDKLFSELISIKNNIKKFVDKSNDKYLSNLRNEFKINCLPIENNNLDFNQIDCVIREDKNILIVAGAGTGKTTTIIGRVKYLVKCLNVNPNEILLLSFTNSSASEMKERVKKDTGIEVDTFTFHKLGLEIIKKSLNKNVNIFDKSLSNFIKIELEEQIKNNVYLSKIIYLLEHLRFLDKDEFDFKNTEEYEEFLTYSSPITLKGEEVKSYGELEIANYLYKNGINYMYENKYKYDTTTLDYREYRPDFYLPEHDLYIEYFGVDRNGNVAPYFNGKGDKTASQIYNESIDWKRKVHEDNKTTMIELFYYQNKEGQLIENLEKQLRSYGVIIKQRDINELWDEIIKSNGGVLEEISKMLETIINLIKSNNYYFDEFKQKVMTKNQFNDVIVDILDPIYTTYDRYLNENGLIDFNDMINKASELVSSRQYLHNYKYVIVDEYQDISYSRYNLLKELRNQHEYKLFCVGDDFQSIYRFSGSDINLFVDFEKYWGSSYIGKIENTYRYTKELADVSGQFIMKNPRQLVKYLNGKYANRYPLSEIVGYTEEYLVKFLETKLQELNKNSTVFLIGRYSFDIKYILKNRMFNAKYNNVTQMTEIEYYKRKDLKITFLTAHKSKGLQADYAIIINNKNRGLGFPSKIQDLPIINNLLAEVDDYPYSEERRLFYVAMTRSKLKTILLVLENNKSIFVKELENSYGNELKKENFECPKCGHSLVFKNGKYGRFLGCSNYPECTYIRK